MAHLKYKTCGYQNCADGHSWGPGVQRDYAFHYIISGKGFYETGGKRYSLSAGECFLVVPNTTAYYYPDMNDPWEYRWVCFYGSDADDIVGMTSLSECPVTGKIDLYGIISAFTRDAVSSNLKLKHEGLLHLLLSQLAETFPSDTQKVGPDYLRLAKKYIYANLYRQDFSVSELSNAVGIERSYLFRLFKEGEGMSVIEYIINARLEAAKDMFDLGVGQVKLVAFSCGYDNPLYFSNSFKKKYDISPKFYIKQTQLNKKSSYSS